MRSKVQVEGECMKSNDENGRGQRTALPNTSGGSNELQRGGVIDKDIGYVAIQAGSNPSDPCGGKPQFGEDCLNEVP